MSTLAMDSFALGMWLLGAGLVLLGLFVVVLLVAAVRRERRHVREQLWLRQLARAEGQRGSDWTGREYRR